MTTRVPEPWKEGDHLPWDDPGFSERMLKEHLSQEHDGASRRFARIDRHVQWIHGTLLGGRSSRIVDLGCGPGLYLQRLAELGHDCVGIDFSPASIAYARAAAKQAGLSIQYLQEDIRVADFGSHVDLAMLIWGEFNAFAPADAKLLLTRSVSALRPNGQFLLEASTFDAIQRRGRQPSSHSVSDKGLFSGAPHGCVEENFWHSTRLAATTRWTVTEVATSATTIYSASYQSYTDGSYEAILKDCGFAETERYPSLAGESDEQSEDLIVLVGKTPEQPKGDPITGDGGGYLECGGLTRR